MRSACLAGNMILTYFIPFLFWFTALVTAVDNPDYCDAVTPCAQGCCSQYNKCGFGPDYCDNCLSNCNSTAECGQYAAVPGTTCPLNVCCSGYGYCGTTDQFCTTQRTPDGTEYPCQSGCLPVLRPSCSANTNAMDLPRRIAYYELWAESRPCDQFPPEAIAAGALTHINIAFAGITADYSITDDDGSMVARIAHLKVQYPGLRVNIAVGGWAFNDPPTQSYFSNMASTKENRSKFITSTFRFLRKYGLDGIDIDWEYPEADDRGGVEADYANYVDLLQDFRDRINSENPHWEVTITIPASYWYLRHFDIKKMEPLVDWFNLMSYDIHGKWDQGNIWTGAYLKGHTNITEIDEALDLLWRNSIQPENVVMGFGFYGRSFTMTDPDCSEPSCTFSGAGRPGSCTDTEGILTYSEIHSRNYTLNSLEFHYDPESTVKYEVYDGNQWISYDDAQSFNDKKKFLTERCLGGLMIWAIDQDTVNYDALAGLLGDGAVQSGLVKGGNLSDEAKADLVDVYAEFTGQDCYITPGCTDETDLTMSSRQRCKAGFTAVERAHNPRTDQFGEEIDTCDTGYWHQVCCPTEHIPQDCEWSNPIKTGGIPNPGDDFCDIGVRALAGSPVRDECPSGKFLLSEDTARNKEGTENCVSTTRRGLCCESNPDLDQCRWTQCGVGCNDDENLQTYRRSDRYGTVCDFNGNPPNPNIIASFCCPKSFKGYDNCEWSRESQIAGDPGNCVAKPCSSTQLKITHALVPPDLVGGLTTSGRIQDCGAQLPTNDANEFSYCCDPPSGFTPNLPVDPAKLWTDPHYEDVEWSYSDEYTNNDKDSEFSGQQAYGDDAYGFIMMDGPTDMISHSFESDFTVVHEDPSEPARKSKRSIITHDPDVLDATFDHKEETVLVYCNYAPGSAECEGIHESGASDTIIKLPTYVGEGPFGRVVSFKPAESYKLPAHHIQARSLEQNTNQVWELTFDYNFNLIKRQSASGNTVNLRIDYTNLLPYWDEMTDSNPDKRKRSADMPPPPRPGSPEFSDLLRRADILRKDKNHTLHSTVDFSDGYATEVSTYPEAHQHEKRWFGTFLRWLQKMTTVESKDKGDLDLMYSKSLLIYSARVGCEQSTLQAGLDIHADASLNLNAQYAYYLSGTIVPPAVGDTFAYFAVQPEAYLGVRMNGNAALRYTSQRKKLIETLTYPGLSIRGLAAVGPTLDLYGQLAGSIKLAGQVQVGAKYTFQRSEGYWPRNSDSATYEKIFGDSDTISTQGSGLEPRLSASVQAEANFDVLVTPEANMGISAFGVVDAQVTAFVNNTLRFHIEGGAEGDNTNGVSTNFDYGVYYLWNIGLNSHGSFSPQALGIGWNSPSLLLFPNGAQEIKLYPQSGSSKRSYVPTIGLPELPSAPRRGLLNPPSGASESSYGFQYMEMDNFDIWGNASDGLALHKRLDADDIASFAKGLIMCPNTTMCNGPGSVDNGGGSCPLNNRPQRRQDGGSDDGNGDGSDAGTCTQDGSDSGSQTCTDQQPRYMYNCAYFPDEQIDGEDNDGNANSVTVLGICRNVRNAMRAESVDNDYQLVYDQSGAETHRGVACPGGYCASANQNLADSLGQGNALTSCDEFPFASTEEGGRLTGIKAVQRQCVPTYQQTLQGSCNGLLGNVEQNVAYDPSDASKQNWKKWSLDASTWNSGRTAWNPPVFDANYPEWAPGTVAPGFSGTIARQQGKNTVQHHRKYTMSIVDTNGNTPSAPNDFISQPFTRGAWLTTALTKTIAKGDVMCAVSTQHSPLHRIAAPPGDGTFNGYCWTGELKSRDEWQDVEVFKGCQVYFGTPATRKREEILGAVLVPDAPVIEVLVPRRANGSYGDAVRSGGESVNVDFEAFRLDERSRS